MTTIATDPLAILALQAGNVSSPLKTSAAGGNTNTQGSQRSIVMGEPIPIVFTRRSGTNGGVMLQPGATEAAFSVNGANTITAKYHLVLGEGQMPGVQRRDVTQIGIRRGSFSQTYDKRAGDWTPGNTITVPATGEFRSASYNCGGGSSGYGTYAQMSTFSFTTVCPLGDESWKGQVSVFIRGGMQVTRLVDGQYGPSSNMVDLLKYLLERSSRIPSTLIDSASLSAAATFVDVNQFRWDGVLDQSTNVRDWLAQSLPYFLLREASVNGKFGLKPLLPTNASGTINTGSIVPRFLFDESSVLGGTFEIEYIPLADRKPICCLMQWRQQGECQWPLVRTTEVRYPGDALSGPFEQHDLSAICTNETHAVKIGAYILARRRYITHTARITLRPGAASTTVVAGDVVQLLLKREASTGSVGKHNRFYQVERIRKTVTGELTLELMHFPIDDTGRSLIALDVAAASGKGLLLNPNTNGAPDVYSCDDNLIPPDDSRPTDDWPKIPDDYYDGDLTGGDLTGGDGAGGGLTGGDITGGDVTGGDLFDGGDFPDDQYEGMDPDLPYEEPPVLDQVFTLPADPGCVNRRVQWLEADYVDANGDIVYKAIPGATSASITITTALVGKNITASYTCDGSTPTIDDPDTTILDPVIPGVEAPDEPNDPTPPYIVYVQETEDGEPVGEVYPSYGPAEIQLDPDTNEWNTVITNELGVETVVNTRPAPNPSSPGFGLRGVGAAERIAGFQQLPGGDRLGDQPQIETPYGRPPVNGETISIPRSSSSGIGCRNPRTQWLKQSYIDQDGNFNWEAIAGATGPNLTITGALGVAGQNVTAVFTCDGSTPTPTNGTILAPVVPGYSAPTNPYAPAPPYRLTLRIDRLATTSVTGPQSAAEGVRTGIVSYGSYYVRLLSTDSFNNKTYVMYVTGSNGQPEGVFTFISGQSVSPQLNYIFIPTGVI
jgi:hypothetical protein